MKIHSKFSISILIKIRIYEHMFQEWVNKLILFAYQETKVKMELKKMNRLYKN